MSASLNLRGMASRLFARATTTPTTSSSLIRSAALPPSRCTTIAPLLLPQTTPFSTTTPSSAKPTPGNPKAAGAGSKAGSKKATKSKGKGARTDDKDPKMIQMMKHLAAHNPRNIPPPLRMARNRHLRHWTIHRGWLLFRRRQREERERNLMRQHQSMSAACEELRQTSGPGTRDMGYLYRVAMEKKGVYGHHGIPIEYARAQTDTPARVAWNHEWKR